MIKAFAAFEPQGKLKPFQYDPGELSMIDNERGLSQDTLAAGQKVGLGWHSGFCKCALARAATITRVQRHKPLLRPITHSTPVIALKSNRQPQ